MRFDGRLFYLDFNFPGARQMAAGVPLLGQVADQGDAAFNATLAPVVEPLMDMIPGVGSQLGNVKVDDRELDRLQAIITSMTPEERANPGILNGSRRRRIAGMPWVGCNARISTAAAEPAFSQTKFTHQWMP